MACTAGIPPELSRMRVAILIATARSSVRRLMLNAISGLRAPTATAPPRGWIRGGPKSGARSGSVADLVADRLVLAATHVGETPPVGTQRRLAVEIDGQVEARGDLLAESPREVDALLDPRGCRGARTG